MKEDRRASKSYEPVQPKFQREIELAMDPLWARLRDRDVEALVLAAANVADDPVRFGDALVRVVNAVVAATDPDVLPWLSVDLLVEWVIRRIAGQPAEPPSIVRLGRLPSVKGNALYVTLDTADVKTVRAAIAVNQIWVHATELDEKQWGTVYSAVRSQRRLLGQPFGHPGRKPGGRDRIRDEVALQVAREADSPKAWAIVVAAGLRGGPYYDRADPRRYERNHACLRRLRHRGNQLLGSENRRGH